VHAAQHALTPPLHFASSLAFSSFLPAAGDQPNPSDRRQVTKQAGARQHKKPQSLRSAAGENALQRTLLLPPPNSIPPQQNPRMP
jgi:hypothetical protein